MFCITLTSPERIPENIYIIRQIFLDRIFFQQFYFVFVSLIKRNKKIEKSKNESKPTQNIRLCSSDNYHRYKT